MIAINCFLIKINKKKIYFRKKLNITLMKYYEKFIIYINSNIDMDMIIMMKDHETVQNYIK